VSRVVFSFSTSSRLTRFSFFIFVFKEARLWSSGTEEGLLLFCYRLGVVEEEGVDCGRGDDPAGDCSLSEKRERGETDYFFLAVKYMCLPAFLDLDLDIVAEREESEKNGREDASSSPFRGGGGRVARVH